MLTDITQRWRNGRAAYRPAGLPFDPTGFEVAMLPHETEIKRIFGLTRGARRELARRRGLPYPKFSMFGEVQ